MMTENIQKRYAFLNKNVDILICAIVIIAAFFVFWQVRDHNFVDYDDDKYVTNNHYVRAGITLEGISWALSATHVGNWHPLTWMSHMMDCQLFGLRPGMHHMTNVFFHMANTILLFVILRRMTGDLWRSSVVMALFALHPLHVESVAWVAERKDVLSTFFWMMTLLSYSWYVERPGPKPYLVTLLFFIMGLTAKPMLVTLPFVLLLLDYWPIRRYRFGSSDGEATYKRNETNSRRRTKLPVYRLILEKVPFLGFAVASSIVTFMVQQKGGAVRPLNALALHLRIGNTLVSYISYIKKMLWPANLAFFYPYPEVLPTWQVLASLLLMVAIFVMVIWSAQRRPYLTVGWLWYVGTLIPVIGLVQIGEQSLADRYTYVSLIGIFIIIAWGIPELVAKWRYRSTGLTAITVLGLLILAAAAWQQVRYWTNSITLFKHAVDVTANNYIAHNNLGVALLNQGKQEETLLHYSEAVRIKPDFEEAYYNLGNALAAQGKISRAICRYTEALQIKPDFVKVHYELGLALAIQGRMAEAIYHYSEALKIEPHFSRAHNSLGIALFREERINEAIVHFREALRINPNHTEARKNLKKAQEAQKRILEAIARLKKLSKNNPDPEIHVKSGNLYKKIGKLNGAIAQYQKALLIQPDYVLALNGLALVYFIKSEYAEAISVFKKLARIMPQNAKFYYNIACIYARQNRTEESIEWLKKAVDKGYDKWDKIKTDRDLKNIRVTSPYNELVRGH